MVDTKHKPHRQGERDGQALRRHHSVAFKRRVIEQTLVPGASVARIALDNGVNANLLFKWRRQHVRATRTTSSLLLPVTVSAPPRREDAPPATPAARMAAASGAIEVQLPAGRIRIKGAIDLPALRVVLQMLAPAA
jgi:transposase